MFKFVIIPLFFAAVSAGYIGAPVAYSAPVLHAAPLLHTAPVVHATPVHAVPVVKAGLPVATSYQNIIKYQSVPVVKHVAYAAVPVVHTPVVHAAPVAVAHAVPVVKTLHTTSYIQHAPVVAAYGHHY